MEKITLEEARISCLDIWDEMVETGSSHKPERADIFMNRCPCCEFTKRYGSADRFKNHFSLQCGLCPVEWVPDQRTVYGKGCQTAGSVYDKWESAAYDEYMAKEEDVTDRLKEAAKEVYKFLANTEWVQFPEEEVQE